MLRPLLPPDPYPDPALIYSRVAVFEVKRERERKIGDKEIRAKEESLMLRDAYKVLCLTIPRSV